MTAKKPKFYDPPNRLKMKAGTGGLPKTIIQRAQKAMDSFKVDFRPEATMLVDSIEDARTRILKAVNENQPYDRDDLVNPVMQLKANGGQFKYQLISDVADICLQFLENIPDYNLEAMDVVKAHENTIKTIIKADLKGDGGPDGLTLVEELHKACTRYFKKYAI